MREVVYPVIYRKSDWCTRTGFYAFKTLKSSSGTEPGSIALDCSTDCKVALVRLFPWLSLSINRAHWDFLSSWKAVLSEAKSLPWEGNTCQLVCHFSHRKCTSTSCFLREKETTAGLRQSCLSRWWWAGGGGNLTAPATTRRGFSWRSTWLISAGLFLQ